MKLSPSLLTNALKGKFPEGWLNAYHSDGRNLYLNVKASGAMSWTFVWKVNGRVREIGLGSFTGAGAATRLTLAEARLAANTVRALIAAGIDPLAERKRARLSIAATFSHVLDQYLLKVPALKGWKPDADGTFPQETVWRASFRDHGKELLGKPVDLIDAGLVGRVLMPIWGRKVGEDMRNRIALVLDHAKGLGHRQGMDNAAAWEGQLKALLVAKPRKASRDTSHAALHYDAVPGFMGKLLGRDGNGAKALAFAVLTATRTDETRLAKWSEIDLEAGLWTIPAERMKAKVEHIVPLSTQAAALLSQIADEQFRHGFVFNGQKGVIGASALHDKLVDPAKKGGMGLKGVATVHGFRSSFRDWVGDKTRFAAADAEMCLAHGLDATEGAYRRHTAVEKRREIMQAWADYCEGRTNVVQLREVA